ncbi:PREDICTED: uncharacterized protein LOC104698870 [Camelina sativa]|uniref:Uncharacterized protein LOC104698870 n=1 Tax=Camelina sativa TaxID=90675 RepID=A0ABM1RS72_CAMSA|nr:PREDICTED: uncharacterized protein LOC104698870 [Camelina sativa]
MMATKESETTVFWDMITCPVTSSSDASRVGQCIKLALKNLGYSGCITITALGILTSIDTDVLRAIYSSGVSLIHINTHHFGFAMELLSWESFLASVRAEAIESVVHDKEPGWFCARCCRGGDQGFENFASHLKGHPHVSPESPLEIKRTTRGMF